MELNQHKNISASVFIDNVKIIDLENSLVYAKVSKDDDEIFLFIKNAQTNRSIKLHIKQFAEILTEQDI